MRIDLSDGVLIEGTRAELLGFAEDVQGAADGEPSGGVILTDDGVETVTIRLEPGV